MRRAIPILMVMSWLLGGCAAQPPVAEVRLVAKAYEQLDAASQPLLDDLALAERMQGRSVAVSRAIAATGEMQPGPCGRIVYHGLTDSAGNPEGPGVIAGFCPEDAAYFSELADPPGTRAFRRATAAIGNYTELLLILAEGRNIEAATAELHALATNTGNALGAVGAAAGTPALAGLTPALNGLLTAVQPLTDLAATHGNVQELERLVRDESPKVIAVVDGLRSASPALFDTVTEASLARYNTEGLDYPEIASAEAARIEGYRTAISNYVLLLEAYGSLLGDLVASYDAAPGSPTLAGLVARSAALGAQADAWRRSLANLRTGLR